MQNLLNYKKFYQNMKVEHIHINIEEKREPYLYNDTSRILITLPYLIKPNHVVSMA